MDYLSVSSKDDLALRFCSTCDGQRNVWIRLLDDGDVVLVCRGCSNVVGRFRPRAAAGK
jgi:hypothetical protein